MKNVICFKKLLLCISIGIIFLFNGYSQSISFDGNAVGVISVSGYNVGSGFVVNNKNSVITCAHVVENKKDILFHPLGKSKPFKLKIHYLNKDRDIAVLKCSEEITQKPLEIDTISNIMLNDDFFYIGYDSSESRVGKKRTVKAHKGKIETIGIYLPKDIPVDFIDFFGFGVPGYSGSPIINTSGKVIGMIRLCYLQSGLKSEYSFLKNRAHLFKSFKFINQF